MFGRTTVPTNPTVEARPTVEASRTSTALGRNLSQWRRMRGMSQHTAAMRAGIHRNTVSRLERGDTSVSLGTVLALADVYGITDSVIGGTNPLNSSSGPDLLLSLVRQRVRD